MVAADPPSGAIRSKRERLIQTLWFEALGLAVVAPLFAWVTGTSAGASLQLLLALSLAVMTWAAVYNTVFDRLEWRRTGRLASDRPHRWRVIHALGLEASSLLVTWPLIVALSSLDWWEALAADLGLTLTYAAYGYAFHWGFDRLRPLRPHT